MLKRWNIYFKERFPIIPRIILGLIVFLEIYFIVLLNNGITDFNIGIQEVVGSFTVFAFLFWLRVADDLKDYETDKRLFKDRPLPSGRVKIKDVVIVCTIIQAIAIALNIIYMNNLYGGNMHEKAYQSIHIGVMRTNQHKCSCFHRIHRS